MPAAQLSTGTDKYVDFAEQRYTVRVRACQETTSPPPDSRPQFEWLMALEGTEDPETGGEIAIKMWTSAIWGETAGKESHLVLVMRAFKGPDVTLADFEALDFPDLVGMRASALVRLNAKGYPTIDKETIKGLGAAAAPKGQTPLPTPAPARPADAGTPARPNAPTPPRRPPAPAAPTGPSEAQLAELFGRALANDPPLDRDAVEAWVAESYPGKTLATISGAEADALINALLPF